MPTALEDERLQGLAERIGETVDAVRRTWRGTPTVGLILGTGLGGFAAKIDAEAAFSYEDLPHFPTSTVESHAGRLVCGTIDCGGGSALPLVAMEGRFHYYEGYSLAEVTYPVRVMRALGADVLIVTNAAGGMNPQYEAADVVIIEDHIDFLPDNPLRGVNDDDLGPRFPDMSEPYDRELIAVARDAALDLSIPAHKGVFVAVAGPNLETRAEYRMLRGVGADVVGMSTVPEVIVAKHAGMRTLGLSIVTDLCLPDALEPVDIAQILAVAARGGERLERLIPRILARLND